MEFITGLLHNTVLVAAVMGWFIAQLLKTIIHLILTKKLVMERMVGSGGMPSSHAATGLEYGADSFAFAIAIILAIIVMHDARGVRWETGVQARILNEMMDVFRSMGTKMTAEEKLKEFVGHTPLQVIVGAVLGILIGAATWWLMTR